MIDGLNYTIISFAAFSIMRVFHPLRGLALKNIANGLLSIILIYLPSIKFLGTFMAQYPMEELPPVPDWTAVLASTIP